MFQILSLIAAFQSLFFGVLILTKKNKSVFDKHLSVWLLFLAVNISCISLFYNNENISFSESFRYPNYILSGLHGFFLYLCTKSLVYSVSSDFIKEHITAFIYLIAAFIGFIFYDLYPQETIIISRISAFVFNVLFVTLSVKLFHQYKKFLDTNFSNIDKLNFNWMKFLASGLILLLGGGLILVILKEFFLFPLSLYDAYSVVILLLINVIGFLGIKYSVIFSQMNIPYSRPPEFPSEDKNKSYINCGLKRADAILLSEKIKVYMESEKPYTNIDLTLKDLACVLDTYPHYVTQVLNTVFNQNFFDYVNTYRVEEAQKRLLDPEFKNLTILAIAYDCGFNSKSTFNRIFKQKTGQTPSEYKNQQEN